MDGSYLDSGDIKLNNQPNRMFGQERKNETRDFIVLLVQGEMASVEQVDFGIRNLALERLRTGSDERGIVPTQTTKIGGLCSRNHACHAG